MTKWRLSVIVSFLVFSYSYQIALCVYIGYQITFVFGSYLVRGETLILKKESLLKAVDISKQSGYLIGLLLSYLIYLFIGIQTSDLKNDKLNLNEHQIELIQHEKQDLLIGASIISTTVEPSLITVKVGGKVSLFILNALKFEEK